MRPGQIYLVITLNLTIAILYIFLLKFLRTNLKKHIEIDDHPASTGQQIVPRISPIPRYINLNVIRIEGSVADGFKHSEYTEESFSVDNLQSQINRMCNTATSYTDPCLAGINGDDLSWNKRQTDRQLSSNIRSSIVRLIVRSYGFPSSVVIKTKDQHNVWKSVGGDYWEIRLYGDKDTVLYVDMRDQGDGTYIGYFVIPKNLDDGDGQVQFRLNYTLEYSQCNGLRDMPKDWFIKGKNEYRVWRGF